MRVADPVERSLSAIPEPGAHGSELTYSGAIGSLLETRCAACHGENASSGLDVTSYESLLAGGESGPGVVPGDLDASWVHRRQTDSSPHYMQFTEEELQLLEDWILAGAPE